MAKARKQVLLIEDDLVIGEALRELLNGEGIGVDQATSEEAADDFLRRREFDAIVLDGTLKGDSAVVDTLPLLQRIKSYGFPGLVIGFSGRPANNLVLCEHGAHAAVVKTSMREIPALLRK